MNNNSSVSGPTGFNSRVSPNEPTPTPPARVEPQPPAHPGYKSSHRDLTPSEAPVLQLPSGSKIASGIAAAMIRHDREVALNSGEDPVAFTQRQLLAELARAVSAGTMSNANASAAWSVAFPGVDPSSVGQQS